MYYQSQVLIIKSKDYRETDKLVTIFSQKEGKLRAIARGVKKPNSSLRACVQPFCHAVLFFTGKKELELITQGRLLNFYGNTREDIYRTLHAVYIMELLDKTLMDRVALPELFFITLSVLKYIDEMGVNPLIIRYFEMSLLQQLGYSPVLKQCVLCGSQDSNLRGFSLGEGGAVCTNCISHCNSAFTLHGETLALLKLISAANLTTLGRVKPSQAAAQQLEVFLEKYLEYHLERRFNMKSTIRKLKQAIPLLD